MLGLPTSDICDRVHHQLSGHDHRAHTTLSSLAPLSLAGPRRRIEPNWLRPSSQAMSSSSTIYPPTKAPPPRRPSAPRAPASCPCRPTAPTSTQSRWLSPSSRPRCAPERSGPSTPSGEPSAKSATYSARKNVKTTLPPRLRIHMKVRRSSRNAACLSGRRIWPGASNRSSTRSTAFWRHWT